MTSKLTSKNKTCLTEGWGDQKRNFNIVTEDTQEWHTPKYILDALGPFDLDPCSPLVRPFDTARKHYTKLDDGLCKPWSGRVWLNPPYPQIQTWMRCITRHGNGIALVYNHLGTHWFDELVKPFCSGLLFLTGNLTFVPAGGSEADKAPYSSVLIAYDPPGERRNNLALKTSRLPGSFWNRCATDKRGFRTIAKNALKLCCAKGYDWLRTPPNIWESLKMEFNFTVDACASDDNHLLPRYWTPEENGLKQDWTNEVVYCHPLFDSNTGKWVEKAYKSKCTTVMLLPSNTGAAYFHKFVKGNPNAEVRFLQTPRMGHRFGHDSGLPDNTNRKGYLKPLYIIVFRNN
jgi:hypothetical protein